MDRSSVQVLDQQKTNHANGYANDAAFHRERATAAFKRQWAFKAAHENDHDGQ